MGKGAIWIGMILVIFGIWLFFVILYSNAPILVLIYPLLSIGIGIALIVLYKEEDKIEQRKDLNKKKAK